MWKEGGCGLLCVCVCVRARSFSRAYLQVEVKKGGRD